MSNPNKFLSSHSHFLSTSIYRWKLWRNIMARAKPGICKSDTYFGISSNNILLAWYNCLIQRVWVQDWLWTKNQSNIKSWQEWYQLWKWKLERTTTKGITYFVLVQEFAAIIYLTMTSNYFWIFLLKIVLYWTIIELTQTITISEMNKLIDWRIYNFTMHHFKTGIVVYYINIKGI